MYDKLVGGAHEWQPDGEDHVRCAIEACGTGGTLAGDGIVLIDPAGSPEEEITAFMCRTGPRYADGVAQSEMD